LSTSKKLRPKQPTFCPLTHKFKYYFEHKDDYSPASSERVITIGNKDTDGRNVSYTLGESYLAQMFYWRYVRPFGYDFLYSYIRERNPKTQQEMEHIVSLCKIYERDCQEEFAAMCDELGEFPRVNALQRYIPFNWENISVIEKDDSFVTNMALLIIFDGYGTDDLNGERIKTLLSKIRSGLGIDYKTINAIERHVIQFCKALYGGDAANALSGSLTATQQDDIPIDGDFILPWKYVDFADSKLFLYHPSEYGKHTTHPLAVYNEKARTAMNNIKRYLVRNCLGVSVHITNGVIDRMNYDGDVMEGVKILSERLRAASVSADGEAANRFSNAKTKRELEREIRELKSQYLDYLCDCQLSLYPIIYCPENRINSDGAQIDEDAFIFTIRKTKYRVTLVFENTLDCRSSYVIRCRKTRYDAVVGIISDYFTSDAVNKRENVERLKRELDACDASFRKVFHDSFESWSKDITIDKQ